MSKHLYFPPVWLVETHELRDKDNYVTGAAKDYRLFGMLVARRVTRMSKDDAKYWMMP